MRKICFFQTLVKFAHRLGLGISTEKRVQASEGAMKGWCGALDNCKQCSHRCAHYEAIPQAAAQLQNLGQNLIGLLPKAADAKNARMSSDQRRGFDPSVFNFGAFGLDTEQNDNTPSKVGGGKCRTNMVHEPPIVRDIMIRGKESNNGLGISRGDSQ